MEKKLKILVLEDDEEDFDSIGETLTQAKLAFTTKRVDSQKGFIFALKNYKADVILSDHALPQFNSWQALSLYLKSGLQIPFILVTGAISEEFAVDTLKQGADDYILKSNLIRLPSAIINAIKQRKTQVAKKHASEALLEKNRDLIKINSELDTFVYSVSHNIRAPLMSLLGLVNLAKTEDNTHGDSLGAYLTMIESSIHKLDDTLKEILDYSRNARQDVMVELIDIKKVIDDNIEKMQYMPGALQIVKTVVVDEHAPVYSDRHRIAVIVNNLISNAIKYYDLDKKNSFLNINVQVSEKQIIMEFKDNGIGINEEYLVKIFDMFFRATHNNNGAGLGLYIVKEAVNKLNGNINIESKINEGTTFKIVIPNYVNGSSLNKVSL